MVIQNVLTQTVALFILILVGYVVKRREVLRDSDIRGITDFIVKVTMPFLIISSMAMEFSMDKLYFSIIMFTISSLSYVFKNTLAKLFTRAFKISGSESSVYEMMIIFANVGFMGFPVVNALYGEEGVFYAAIINISFNIFIWTLGINILSRNDDDFQKVKLRSLFKNPGIISVGIGFVLFILPIRVPEFLMIPMNMVGEATTPLAMMIIGTLLVNTDIRRVIGNKKLLLSSAIRIVLLPLIFMGFMLPLGLPPEIVGIMLVLESMPAASSIAIFARRFEADYELASQGVFLSTLLNVLTIPIILYLFSLLFGL